MRLGLLTGKAGVLQVSGSIDTEIKALCFDSRRIEPGCCFFAVPGTASDGHDYMEAAVDAGALAVVCERLPASPSPGIAWIQVSNAAAALGEMASAFYGHPSRKLILTGVTGTNGKTTTVTLLYRLFMQLGYATGLLSTIRNMINGHEVAATHTTPDPVQLNRLLAEMAEAGCEYCFMEVSSHAVSQSRIAGLHFAGGVFTNLTHDHLDYHGTFDAYLGAKKQFFDGLDASAFVLINKDDRNGRVMVQNSAATRHTYSLRSMAGFRCRILENSLQGLHLELDGREAWFRLIGAFNAYNLLAAYGTAVLLGQERDKVLTLLSGIDPVDGRFNHFRSPSGITAIVDYAHTPDALKNVLETINGIREHNEQLITVAGAGGNRDKTKRPVMAAIAATLSDRVILTSDNPRNEEPETILAQMQAGIEKHLERKVLTIVSRQEAIRTACALARAGDIILVAGKGHENYQEINGVRHHFDDREVLAEALGMNNPEKR
jgi:UDP-N-acetylmuramoyl-L-alanyl-D-glutamate--2,6-diaminopimelate ligase